jgi:hypothetical protein
MIQKQYSLVAGGWQGFALNTNNKIRSTCRLRQVLLNNCLRFIAGKYS